jgi:hypothetical protein
VIGRLADLLRLAWGLLYWNVAKTRFRLRGARDRCPCQSPSDSGRAFETICEASLTWHRPEAFRRVCPLLKRDRAGALRCSVDTADVRPFWGRALALSFGSALALYLAGTLAFFALQRAVGIPVGYATIAYPPHWPRLALARSIYFTQKADRALAAGKINEAEMSLSVAVALDAGNVPAALKLALLSQHAQPARADALYERLLRDQPAQRAVIATAWWRALLLRADFPALVPLAAAALHFDAEHEAAWLHALLFALRRVPVETLRAVAASPELPAAARDLLALELVTRTEPPARARAALLMAEIPLAYFDYFRIERLIALGFTADARVLLRATPQLDDRDRAALTLDANAEPGRSAFLDQSMEQLLAAPPGPVTAEVLAVHLIRHPDRTRLARVFAAFEKNPLPANEAGRAAQRALLCAAGAAEEAVRFRAAAAALEQIADAPLHALPLIEAFFFGPTKTARIESILPLLQPVAAEVNYALLAHHRPAAPRSENAPSR